jgi:O-antigen/teichoic acid export membrane protein
MTKMLRALPQALNIKASGFNKYFKNTSWLLTDKLVGLGMAFVVGAMVARFLGPNDYGNLMYAYSLASFLMVFAKAGLDSIMVRNLVNNPNDRATILGTGFTLKYVGSFLSLAVFFIISRLVPDAPLTNYLVLIILLSTLFQPFTVVDSFFQSKVQSKYVVMVHLTQVVIISISKLLLIYYKAGVVWFAYAFLAENIVYSIGLLLVYRLKDGSILDFQVNWKYAGELIKDGWPLLFSGFVIMVYTKIDQIMIKHMLDATSVGHYAVSVKITKIWNFLGVAITASVFPAIINSKRKGSNLYLGRLQKLYDLMAGTGILIGLMVTLLASILILTIFGPSYEPSIGVLRIQIWAILFVFLGVASDKWLVTENMQKITLHRTGLGAIANIILNLILIPTMGIKGAALATVISQAIASYLGFAISGKTWKTFLMLTKSLFLINVIRTLVVKK